MREEDGAWSGSRSGLKREGEGVDVIDRGGSRGRRWGGSCDPLLPLWVGVIIG